MKYSILSLIFIALISIGQSQEYLQFEYITQNGDTLNKIINRFQINKTTYAENKNVTREIINKNPHIKNWMSLKTNTPLTVLIDERNSNNQEIQSYLKQKNNDEILSATEVLQQEKSYREGPQHHLSFFYTNKKFKSTETEPLQVETPVNSNFGIGIGYDYHFSIFEQNSKFSILYNYNKIEDIEIISTTNPDIIKQKVTIPSISNYSAGVTVLSPIENFDLYLGMSRNTLYNVEFFSTFDQDILRKTQILWAEAGPSYYLINKDNVKWKFSVIFGSSMNYESVLLDPLNGTEFTEDASSINIDATKVIFGTDIILKKYFINFSLGTYQFVNEKTIEFVEGQTNIGITF